MIEYLVLMEKKTFTRSTASNRWSRRPDAVKLEVVNLEFYRRYRDAISFFNGFLGGSCSARCSYTPLGLIPTTITTIDPSKTDKTVVTFDFIYTDELKSSAGWREREILNNARAYSWSFADGQRRLTLYTAAEGVTASGIYNFTRARWEA